MIYKELFKRIFYIQKRNFGLQECVQPRRLSKVDKDLGRQTTG